MPTIEIASINSTGLDQADFNVAIIEENKLESHRGLFYDLLREQNGAIVHIGNPDFKADKESGFYKINAEKVIIASCDNELVEWKFVTVDNPKMKVLLEKFIPKELLN